jgi:hypothetical protein
MARTSRKNLLTNYRACLEHAIRFREEEGYDAMWVRMTDLYRGRHLPTTMSEEDQLVVNVSFSTINVIYPSVSVNYPKITVAPNKPEDEDRAVFTEAIINYQWKHFELQDPFRLAVKDYLIMGHGWLKVGWKFTEKEIPLDGYAAQDEFNLAIEEADSFAVERPELAAELPTNGEIAETLPTTKVVVEEDRPTVERVSPYDIYVDPEATCMDDAKWIAQRVVREYEEVKKDKRYKAAVRSRLEPDLGVGKSTARSTREWRRRHAATADDQRVTIWEWWDMRSGTLCVFGEGADEFLVDPTPQPYAFGHPFVMLRNYDVPDYFYPMGDLEALECLQQELNALRTIQMSARHTFARKHLIRARAFGPQGRAALESDEDNEFVEVLDEQTPFGDLIAPVPQTPIDPQLYQDSDLIENDIGDVSGVSEYQRGQVPETRRTATEAAMIGDSTNARAADKLAQIEIGIGRVARKVVAVNAQFVSQEEVARVVGPDGAIIWVPYDRDDVSGEYDFEVEAGSTQPRNETVRRQEAVQLAQAAGEFVQLGIIDPRPLARHLLQNGFGIRNPDKCLMPPPPMIDPMTGMPMIDPATGMPMQAPPGVPPQGGGMPGGVGGAQPPPMGNGYTDSETGQDPQSMAQAAF